MYIKNTIKLCTPVNYRKTNYEIRSKPNEIKMFQVRIQTMINKLIIFDALHMEGM